MLDANFSTLFLLAKLKTWRLISFSLCVHELFGGDLFFPLRLIRKKWPWNCINQDVFIYFCLFFKRDTRLTLFYHPAHEDSTYLSCHWVRWVMLYIEWSKCFDIRRRPQCCNPVNPLPPHSPLLSISGFVSYSQTHCFKQCWQLLFTLFHQIVQRLDIQDGQSGWKQKGGRRQTAMKWKLFRKIA